MTLGKTPRVTVSIECTVEVAAVPSRVWWAVTTAEGLAQWLAPAREHSGSRWTLIFDEDPVRVKSAHVLDCHVDRRVAVLWEDPGTPQSTVHLTLAPLGADRTRVVLRHDTVPASLLAGYARGWPGYLGRLRWLCETN